MGMRLKKTCRDVERVISPWRVALIPTPGSMPPRARRLHPPMPTGASFPVSFQAIPTCPPKRHQQNLPVSPGAPVRRVKPRGLGAVGNGLRAGLAQEGLGRARP